MGHGYIPRDRLTYVSTNHLPGSPTVFEFNTTRTAAQTGDMTDRTWTAEAVADGAVVADYTLAPIETPAAASRWVVVRGTIADLAADDDALVGSYDSETAAHEAAEWHARGLHHGARDAAAGKAMADPDALGAMGGEFAGAYREAFEAWHADDAAAEAERRAGA